MAVLRRGTVTHETAARESLQSVIQPAAPLRVLLKLLGRISSAMGCNFEVFAELAL